MRSMFRPRIAAPTIRATERLVVRFVAFLHHSVMIHSKLINTIAEAKRLKRNRLLVYL